MCVYVCMCIVSHFITNLLCSLRMVCSCTLKLLIMMMMFQIKMNS